MSDDNYALIQDLRADNAQLLAHCERAKREHDDLRERAERAEAEVERMRPAYEAAVQETDIGRALRAEPTGPEGHRTMKGDHCVECMYGDHAHCMLDLSCGCPCNCRQCFGYRHVANGPDDHEPCASCNPDSVEHKVGTPYTWKVARRSTI